MRRAALLLAIPFALRAQTPEQLFQDRRLAEAKSAFQAQLARDKSDANAMYYLGRIALAENNSDEAADWFEKAVKRNDRSSLYHLWLGNAIGNEVQTASKFRQPFLARRLKSDVDRDGELDPT